MRVVAGHLGGRTFEAPHGHRTHPMGDKIRGALFNTLGDIKGLTLLDACAGSGAVSIEAISRGAVSAVAIDVDKEAHRALKKNMAALGLEDQVQVVYANAASWSARNWKRQYDLVILDPPYDNLQYKIMEKVAMRHTKPGGLAVFSVPPNARVILPPDQFELIADKSYGDAQLKFYRCITSN